MREKRKLGEERLLRRRGLAAGIDSATLSQWRARNHILKFTLFLYKKKKTGNSFLKNVFLFLDSVSGRFGCLGLRWKDERRVCVKFLKGEGAAAAAAAVYHATIITQ